MYITKHGEYQYLEHKVNGKVVIKISLNKVEKILLVWNSLSSEQQKLFLERMDAIENYEDEEKTSGV